MLEQTSVALLLSYVVNGLVQAIAEPIKNKFPEKDLWWLFYVGLVLGAVLSWFANVNLFADVVAEPIGKILTAVLVGRGSTTVADLLNYLKLKKDELKTAIVVNEKFSHTHEEK